MQSRAAIGSTTAEIALLTGAHTIKANFKPIKWIKWLMDLEA